MLTTTVTSSTAQVRCTLVAAKALAFGIKRMSLKEGDAEVVRLAIGLELLVDQALASIAALENRTTRGAVMNAVQVHDVSRAVRRAQIIEGALRGAHPEEARSLICWTLARVGRGSGLTKCEFAGRVLSDLEAGWKFQTLNRVPVLP